jgi:hypothetical protein
MNQMYNEGSKNKRHSEVILPNNLHPYMDNNQKVDEICSQFSVSLSKHIYNVP